MGLIIIILAVKIIKQEFEKFKLEFIIHFAKLGSVKHFVKLEFIAHFIILPIMCTKEHLVRHNYKLCKFKELVTHINS